MEKPKELSKWDFPDTEYVYSGNYEYTTVPKATTDNMVILIERHNNLVSVINYLCDKHGIILED